MNDLIMLSIIGIIILIGLIRNVDVFNVFLDGVKESLKIATLIFPFVFSFSICLVLIESSGIITFLEKSIRINSYIILQTLLRPLSSQSSLLLVLKVYDNNGIGSVYSNFSTLLHSSIDAFMYIICLYSTNITLNKRIYIDSFILYVITIVICIVFSLIIYLMIVYYILKCIINITIYDVVIKY